MSMSGYLPSRVSLMAVFMSLTVGLSSSLGCTAISTVVLVGRIIDADGDFAVLLIVLALLSGLSTSIDLWLNHGPTTHTDKQ